MYNVTVHNNVRTSVSCGHYRSKVTCQQIRTKFPSHKRGVLQDLRPPSFPISPADADAVILFSNYFIRGECNASLHKSSFRRTVDGIKYEHI